MSPNVLPSSREEGKFKSVSKNIKTLKIMTKKETAKFIVLL